MVRLDRKTSFTLTVGNVRLLLFRGNVDHLGNLVGALVAQVQRQLGLILQCQDELSVKKGLNEIAVLWVGHQAHGAADERFLDHDATILTIRQTTQIAFTLTGGDQLLEHANLFGHLVVLVRLRFGKLGHILSGRRDVVYRI